MGPIILTNKRLFLQTIVLGLLNSACKKPVTTFEDEALLNKLYLTSVDTLVLQDHEYILDTYLNRDFFPGIGIGKKTSLIADIYLVNIDSTAIPSYIDIKKLYIIQDQLIWASTPIGGVQPSVPEFKLNKLSRDGPEWNTGIYVDAIIMIVNSLTKEEYYIIARKQYINRSE
jgi:hypothetical protein